MTIVLFILGFIVVAFCEYLLICSNEISQELIPNVVDNSGKSSARKFMKGLLKVISIILILCTLIYYILTYTFYFYALIILFSIGLILWISYSIKYHLPSSPTLIRKTKEFLLITLLTSLISITIGALIAVGVSESENRIKLTNQTVQTVTISCDAQKEFGTKINIASFGSNNQNIYFFAYWDEKNVKLDDITSNNYNLEFLQNENFKEKLIITTEYYEILNPMYRKDIPITEKKFELRKYVFYIHQSNLKIQ